MNEYSIERFRDKESGQLIAYAWPGGYQIMYYTKDNDPICPDCAARLDAERTAAQLAYEAASAGIEDLRAKRRLDEHWSLMRARDVAPVYSDVFYEGPAEYCAECNALVESAYGDPDEDEDEAPAE